MAQYRSPAPMNFDEPKWDTWKSQFMTFRLVTKLHNEENVVQIASLKYCMGGEAEAIMKTFNLTDGQRNNFEQPSEKKGMLLKNLVHRFRRLRVWCVETGTDTESIYCRTT